MAKPPKIIDLAKILEPHLNGGKLIDYSSRYLTKPGDNYGSVMLAISADIQNSDGQSEQLQLVAKLPPLTNELFWTLFNPLVTALRENAIYVELSPSLRQLQLDSGIPETEISDVFAEFYGCRISLDEKATVLDRNAVLVLENVQINGYKPGNRHNMFDYEHIKFVLKHLAKYHALPIALRQKQPEKFQRDILPNFRRYDISKEMNEEVEEQFKGQVFEEVRLALIDDPEAFDLYLQLATIFYDFMGNPEECQNSLFSTIAHYDLWTNNIMIKYDESGAPEKIKFVDFQISQYESLMHDLIFLLLTSVETSVVDEHFYDLMVYYYSEFMECLEKTLCSTEEYSFDKFMAEMHRIAPIQIHHAMYMARVLLADDNNFPDDFKDIDLKMLEKRPSDKLLQKIRDIVRLSKKFGFFCDNYLI
ncbi:uncharacterized protein LOC129907436 [Episyrphus balteatus]|uniref:uncharacterized protein LOC129907436 n=1 Tax=Episyrphus balteatus TaxID=286459 RepID=UPI0024850198|nr:uncharacterized protein LOC129907436 [Episyrphus balteatus]XP_055839758.1 uncharacterized protein LOC129907436 [Episyrphus balteatus]